MSCKGSVCSSRPFLKGGKIRCPRHTSKRLLKSFEPITLDEPPPIVLDDTPTIEIVDTSPTIELEDALPAIEPDKIVMDMEKPEEIVQEEEEEEIPLPPPPPPPPEIVATSMSEYQSEDETASVKPESCGWINDGMPAWTNESFEVIAASPIDVAMVVSILTSQLFRNYLGDISARAVHQLMIKPFPLTAPLLRAILGLCGSERVTTMASFICIVVTVGAVGYLLERGLKGVKPANFRVRSAMGLTWLLSLWVNMVGSQFNKEALIAAKATQAIVTKEKSASWMAFFCVISFIATIVHLLLPDEPTVSGSHRCRRRRRRHR